MGGYIPEHHAHTLSQLLSETIYADCGKMAVDSHSLPTPSVQPGRPFQTSWKKLFPPIILPDTYRGVRTDEQLAEMFCEH